MGRSDRASQPRPKEAPAPRLPDGLAEAELAARRAERLDAAALKAGRTPLQVIEVAGRAAERAEEAVRDFRAAALPPRLACREGCDWCCHLPVGTTAAEVLRVADYLRKALSPDELHALRGRLAEREERRRRQSLGERAADRPACALLVEHRCIAYPVRPLTCRGMTSTDAGLCERFLSAPTQVTVPGDVARKRLTTFVLDGLRAGLAEAGLNGDLLELSAALRIALEVPDAAERWLAGGAPFAPARLN